LDAFPGDSWPPVLHPQAEQHMLTKMEKETKHPLCARADEMADFILDVGVFLMASGAHSGRVNRNCERIANQWGYHIHISPNFTGILVTVWDKEDSSNTVTRYKASPASSIHLHVLTSISHLSWKIAKGETSFEEARKELEQIRMMNHYRFWQVALAVGVSCGLLCTLAGGDMVNAGIAFIASATGYLLRHWLVTKRFNLFLSVILASAVTTMIAGIDIRWLPGVLPEMTLSTAVLYLVPGVPLINSVIDLLEGYFPASIARSLYAASVLLCIAAGMTVSIWLMGISNF